MAKLCDNGMSAAPSQRAKTSGRLDIEQKGFVAYLDGFTGSYQILNVKVDDLSNGCHKTPELGSSRFSLITNSGHLDSQPHTTNRVMSERLDPCVSHVKACRKFEV